MSRTNIFDVMTENNDIAADARRIFTLFAENAIFESNLNRFHHYSLKPYIEDEFFYKWKGKGKSLNAGDFLNTIGFENIVKFAFANDLEHYIRLIEVVYNYLYIGIKYDRYLPWNLSTGKGLEGNRNADEYQSIKNYLDDRLIEYNYKAYYNAETERCIIIEDSPQVTAAAEAVEPEVSLEIIRYNHRQLKGNIARKQAVLRNLGHYLDGRDKAIKSINNSLYDTITNMLNNLDIRHNNIYPEKRNYYHEALAKMTDEELEKWYDDLYQLILLAIIEMDNVERKRNANEMLKQLNN